MGWYALLLLAAVPTYFLYAVFSSLQAARRRRDEAAARFGTYQEHPPEDWESLYAQWKLENEAEPDSGAVDDITWSDLEMGQVFHRINACLTSPGEERLYNHLRSLRDPGEDWEPALAVLDRDPALRQGIQTLLNGLGKDSDSGLTELMRSPDDYRLPHAGLLRVCPWLPAAALALVLIPPTFGVGIIGLLASLITNAALSYWGNKKLQGRLHTMSYARALLWCARKLCRLPMPGLEMPQAELKNAFRPFSRLRGTLSGTMQEAVSAGDLAAIQMFAQIFFLSDIRGYNRAMALFSAHAEELRRVYDLVGWLDEAISVLSLRKSLSRFCVPSFTKEMALRFEEAVHPLLNGGVGNSGAFARGTLITGSNASGKSTFLKTLAVNAILAQSIRTCAAASFSLPRAQVLSSMALRDNLAQGDSYFVVEIKSFLRILKAAHKSPCLCFVDEILRGTNTIERIAASAAVLKSLQGETSLCVAATHDIELADILSGQYDNYHFREELKDREVRFDYKLRPGPSRTRNALLLLGAYGFPEQVVEKAREMAAAFEREHRWPAPHESAAPAAWEGGDASAPAQAG